MTPLRPWTGSPEDYEALTTELIKLINQEPEVYKALGLTLNATVTKQKAHEAELRTQSLLRYLTEIGLALSTIRDIVRLVSDLIQVIKK